MSARITKTTCPRDCYDSCGLSVHVEGGSITVRGDHDHHRSKGTLCRKCALAYNGAWINADQRILDPLKRVGQKGEGRFVAVSWEEALQDIARRLRSICDSHSPESIFHTHYTGTCSLIAGNFPLRFFRRLGATEVDPDSICNKAGLNALRYVLGDPQLGFDPRTANASRCLMLWGANPAISAPHIFEHWLPSIDGPKIVVDPIRQRTADAADFFLQLRPGTDAALAFAMMNVALQLGLTDRHFLDTRVVGWDLLEPNVLSMTPQCAEQITGVPAKLIIEVATEYAKGPSLMWIGQGMQRRRTGGNTVRAIAALCLATGNIGRDGAGLLYLNGPQTRGVDLDYLTAAHLSKKPVPTVSHMILADRLLDTEVARAFISWNNNVAASSPQQSKLRTALAREDLFHVAIDLFATDTTDFADYLLPAASFLEFDDVLLPYFDNTVSALAKAVEPLGRSLPNQEIFRKLAAHMGYANSELFEDDRTIIDRLLSQVGWDEGFSALATCGTAQGNAEPRVQFAGGCFPTESGKAEIASRRALADGHPLVPTPEVESRSAPDLLQVISPASEWTLNSSYANDLRIHARIGKATVFLSPTDALVRGIEEGQQVVLRNEAGTLSVQASISDRVPAGVALLHKGRWPRRESHRSNVNVLNPGTMSDMGESTAVHSVEAYLEPALCDPRKIGMT